MQYHALHSWENLDRAFMDAIQSRYVPMVYEKPLGKIPGIVAGVDVAYDKKQRFGYCAIVCMEYQSGEVLEVVHDCTPVRLPYIPGYLAFRELPIILSAWKKVTLKPDVVFFDGNGRLHQKRFGIASHAALFLEIPTVGIAKSYLCGHSAELGESAGSQVAVLSEDEVVGMKMRIKDSCQPVYVSVGHGLLLEEACEFVWHFSEKRYKVPKITRIADKESKKARDGFLPKKVGSS